MADNQDDFDEKKTASWMQPNAEPMLKEELKEAIEGQSKYPEIVRKDRDTPIPDQAWSIVSFMVLPEPKDGVYAFVKCRGSYPSEQDARRRGKKIIRDVDSLFPLQFCPTGAWVPVTNDSKFAKNEEFIMDAKQKKEANFGIIGEEKLEQARKQHDKIVQDVHDRAKQLLDPDAPDDPYSDKEGLDYYCQKRVTMNQMCNYTEELKAKLEKLETKKQLYEIEIAEIERVHPEHIDAWESRYNEKREEVGLGGFKADKWHRQNPSASFGVSSSSSGK